MIKRYYDFELQVSLEDRQLKIDINGRPTAINLPEPIRVQLASHLPTLANFASAQTQDIAQLGHSLFDTVFVSEVMAKFQAYLHRRQPHEGVRVCVLAQQNELNDTVWETLCDQIMPISNFLALNPKTPVVRISKIGMEVRLRKLKKPVRLLVVFASPQHVQRIDPQAEKQAVALALKQAVQEERVRVDYLGFENPTEGSYDKLQEYLFSQHPPYDIVHIIGHGLLERGYEGLVALVDAREGKQQDVMASNLVHLFQERGVMLVILQACQSGAVDPTTPYFSSLAQQLIASGVPAVLAMQETIQQDVARHFIEKVYTFWLSKGSSFEDAVTLARHSVYQQFRELSISWAIPVLYISPGVQLLLEGAGRRSQPGKIRERQMDAALPRQVRLGKETELILLLRMLTSRGLRERMSENPEGFVAGPDDVQTSPTFEVFFPSDEKTGKLLPSRLRIAIETSDFDLPLTEDTVQIYTEEDVLKRFRLTPKKEGAASLQVRVVDTTEKQATLAQLSLHTEVRSGEAFESEYLFVDTARVWQREVKKTPGQRMQESKPTKTAKEAIDLSSMKREGTSREVFPSSQEDYASEATRRRKRLTSLKQVRESLSSLLDHVNSSSPLRLYSSAFALEKEFLHAARLLRNYADERDEISRMGGSFTRHTFLYFAHELESLAQEFRQNRDFLDRFKKLDESRRLYTLAAHSKKVLQTIIREIDTIV